jgi:hypothetical protein
MKISVSKQDITLGKKTPISNTRCPVARAMKRAGLKNVCVGITWANFESRKKFQQINFRRKVSRFIEDLTENKPLKPFSFSIRVA